MDYFNAFQAWTDVFTENQAQICLRKKHALSLGDQIIVDAYNAAPPSASLGSNYSHLSVGIRRRTNVIPSPFRT